MKTHPLNVSYLVVGLIFLGLAGSWALHAADVVDLPDARWLFPLILVAAGVIGLVAFAARGIRGPGDHPAVHPADPSAGLPAERPEGALDDPDHPGETADPGDPGDTGDTEGAHR